jgi:hypothetical protein
MHEQLDTANRKRGGKKRLCVVPNFAGLKLLGFLPPKTPTRNAAVMHKRVLSKRNESLARIPQNIGLSITPILRREGTREVRRG